MIKADHKVLSEEGESRNNHRYAVVPCKSKNFSGDGKEFTKVSRAVRIAESHLQTIRGNVANPLKIYRGITERPLLIDPRQMAFLRHQYEE